MTPSTPCAAALAELVEATDENAGVMHAFSFRQARALKAARAVLAAAKLQTEDQGSSEQFAADDVLIGSPSIRAEVREPTRCVPFESPEEFLGEPEPTLEHAYAEGRKDEREALTELLPAAAIFRIKKQADADGLDVVGFAWRIQKAAFAAPPSGAAPQAEPPKCDNRQQCSPDARYDRVSHGLTSLTLKCRLCGGIRRSGWD